MILNNFINKLVINKKMYIILIFFALVGLILMISQNEVEVVNKTDMEHNTFIETNSGDDNQGSEQKLKKILSEVEGVGDVDVFINYKKNITNKNSLFLKDDISAAESCSLVEGVIIVAQGGDNGETVSVVRNSISEIFCIPLHKVIVLKMRE